LAVAGWLVLTAAMVGLGLLVTGAYADSSLIAWDERVPKVWEEARTAQWNGWTELSTALSDTIVVIAVASAVGSLLLLTQRRASALLLATALALELLSFVTTTFFVARDRPDVKLLDASPPTSSFPSGHTAAAVALYVTLAIIVMWNTNSRLLRVLGWLLPVIAVPVVATSRLYRGMHHPTDLLAGFVLGGCCVLVAYLAVKVWLGDSLERDVT